MSLTFVATETKDSPQMPMLYRSAHVQALYETRKSGFHKNEDIPGMLGLVELFKDVEDDPSTRREAGMSYLTSELGMNPEDAGFAWEEFVDWRNRTKYPTKSRVEKASEPDKQALSTLFTKWGGAQYYSGKAILAAVQLLKAGRNKEAAEQFGKARDGFEPKKNPDEYKILDAWREYAESKETKSLTEDELTVLEELKSVANLTALLKEFVLTREEVKAFCPDCVDEMEQKGSAYASLVEVVEKAQKRKKQAGRFGTADPGLFTRCVAVMSRRKGVTNPEGLCANIHEKVTGMWPGEHSGKNPEGPEKSSIEALVIAEDIKQKLRL